MAINHTLVLSRVQAEILTKFNPDYLDRLSVYTVHELFTVWQSCLYKGDNPTQCVIRDKLLRYLRGQGPMLSPMYLARLWPKMQRKYDEFETSVLLETDDNALADSA